MKKDEIFFVNKNANAEIKLTSTSANEIANRAKEYFRSIESVLDSISFTQKTVSLLGTDEKIIEKGYQRNLSEISIYIKRIAKCKSLIAWLREAIKARENLIREINNTSIEDYCALKEISMPKRPIKANPITMDDYLASLSVKTRNQYYQLEAVASSIGSYIHEGGRISVARKDLQRKLQQPYEVISSGRENPLIYSYTPTQTEENVESLFFDLQQEHREAQKQLNAIKFEGVKAIEKSVQETNSKYESEVEEYNNTLQLIRAKMGSWQSKKVAEIGDLRIIITDSLKEIYSLVANLGKRK